MWYTTIEVIRMALSQAKRASDARHIAKLDVIKIQPYKEEGIVIRAAAASSGKSLQAYILQAVREKMEREGYTVQSSTGSDDK